jgi:hypothetical protein
MKTILNSIGQPAFRLGNFTTLCAALLFLGAPVVLASDPVGIYAFVDKVVFEPSEAAPERIQVWGAFALAKKAPGNLEYSTPERGYVYFKLRPGDEDVIKKEWADLKSVAGTRQVVAFGFRHAPSQPTLRKADAKVENPDPHPTGMGITKIGENLKDRPQVKQLTQLMDKPAGDKPAPGKK